ncbi:unnamed protein product [Mytilus coruscus]|uniref:Endonuclease/exonuclease/phosphatase domain-containing protein n=1 Tax=Mytilus coruscus TaxID=42192 RepID=A0A6J8BIL9_MYTCO|nr:unnamed protein product [Mytilus coruscus]
MKRYKKDQDITVNSLFTTVNRLKSPRAYPYKCKSVTSYLLIILLANANDVNPNPGPTHNDSTIYPCGTCDQPVTWDDRAIRCDTCDLYYFNSFNLLLESTLDMSTASQQESVKPKHTSTPKREKQEKRNKPFIPLRILNVNCQSIRNKQHQIQNLIDNTKPDVMIMTETWLDSSITNSQIFPSDYNIYRKDRKGNTKLGEESLSP